MDNENDKRIIVATFILQGLLANPGGPIQKSDACGWDFCNTNMAATVKLAVTIADDLIRQSSEVKS